MSPLITTGASGTSPMTTTTSAPARGYCQVCGHYCRITRDGFMPKHGTGRGKFRETCPGSVSLPIMPTPLGLRPTGTPPTDRIRAVYAEAVAAGKEYTATKYAERIIAIYKYHTDTTMDEVRALEREEGELRAMFAKLGDLFWLVKAVERYGKCRFCQKELSQAEFDHAKRRHEPAVCSTECRRKEEIKLHACCEKATHSPCVCLRSFTCPDHGTSHQGTHD